FPMRPSSRRGLRLEPAAASDPPRGAWPRITPCRSGWHASPASVRWTARSRPPVIDRGGADSRPAPRSQMYRAERWSVMSHPHGKYLAVALAVLAALGAARPAQAQVTLRYKFKEGEKLRYLMTLTMKMKIDVGGKDVEANATMKMPMSMQTVKVFKDGKAEVLMRLEGMKMSMEMGEGKSFSFDTDNLEGLPEEARDMLQKMLKDGITLTMDTLGHASDVKVPESWKELMQKGGQGPLNLDALTGKGGMMGYVVFPKGP